MDTPIVLAVIALLLVLLAMRVPVAFSLAISGSIGLLWLYNVGHVTNVLGSVPFSMTATFTLTIVPMFILMGMFALRANIAENVFIIANRVVGRVPGGLGVATVMACAGFAAVSGSSIGTAATMSQLSVGHMRKAGYRESFATGLVAVAGTLGVMIPPSTFLVLYAVLAGESVSAMLAAGLVPGVISALSYVAYIMIVARRNVETPASQTLEQGVEGAREELMERALFRDLPWRSVGYIGILVIVVLGGIYSGVFTSTEAAAAGAFSALIILIIESAKGGLKAIVSGVKDALLKTAETTSMVFFIIVASGILSTFLVSAGVTRAIGDWATGLNIAPHLVLALLLLTLIPLGMFLESTSMLIITVPLIYPIAMEFGFDGIWLGILIVKLIEMGMVTPPVGIIGFVVSGASGAKSETVFRGIIPFTVIDLAVIALIFMVPEIVLFVPDLID